MSKELIYKYCSYCGFETFHNRDKCLTHNEVTEEEREMLHKRMHE